MNEFTISFLWTWGSLFLVGALFGILQVWYFDWFFKAFIRLLPEYPVLEKIYKPFKKLRNWTSAILFSVATISIIVVISLYVYFKIHGLT